MGTKCTLADLNSHLFEQLERLNDDDLDPEALDRELKRADGLTKIANQIIQNGELAFKTMKHRDEWGTNGEPMPPMLEMRAQRGGA